MKIIVCGAGEIGSNIAKQLVYEDNDVTIIDESESLLRSLNKSVDLKSICGKTSHPEILEKAGADEADMIIAVSDSDEMNIISCEMANHLFKIPLKVARIKENEYLNPNYFDKLFSSGKIDVDAVISPELEVAKDIIRKLNTPGAFDSFYLGNKIARIIGISINEKCPVINTPLRMLPGIFSGLEVKILSIFRNNEIIVPTGQVELYPGDDIYICIKNKDILRALRVFGIKTQENRKLIVVGAGNIGLNILKILEKDYPDINCKIIDNDLARTKNISSQLSKQNTILCGDAIDSNLLKEAGASNAEAIITVTNDDEVNIFSSLLAKDLGCKRTMAIVNNFNYRNLSKKLDLDVLINPGNITTSAILQYVRRGKVKEVHDFGNDRGEIMEIEILPTTKFADKKIQDLDMPAGVIIGGIVRNEKLIFPDESTTIFVKDKLIIFSDPSSIKEIEKYSEVNIEFFLMRYCYINGLYKSKTEAQVSIEDRGFNFADGVYEVMSFSDYNLINLSRHISRLERSLDGLKIRMPFKNVKSLELIIQRLIHINKLRSGFLYLQITRGSAKRNHLFPKSTKPNIVIFSFSLKYDEKIFNKGVNICLADDIRWGRCDIKSISLLPNVLEKQKAFENGFFETWQIKNNSITEGATSNAFIVNKKNEIQTHPSNSFILGGVTRDTIIEIAQNNNFMIKEKAFTIDELFDSKEAFLTSTTAKILPVVKINQKKVNNGKPGDITQILIKKYNEFLKQQINE